MLSIQKWLESQLEYSTKERREKVEELRITSEGLGGELDLSDFFKLKKLFCGNNKITRLILPFPNKLEQVNAKYEEIISFSSFQDRGKSELKKESFYSEKKSPIFVCAHANNTPWQVDFSLNKGVNAMETDIWKDREGQIWAAHDNILDEGKATKIEEFLDHLKENVFATGKGDKIVLWIWDLKETMGTDNIRVFRDKVNEAIPRNVYSFYCIYGSEMPKKIVPILGDFGEFEGINYDSDYHFSGTPMENILKWRNDNRVQNFIYSCGRIPGVPANLEEIRKELKAVVDLRNNSKEQVFGVYTWTLRDLVSSKEWLKNLFLNGIIGDTNELFGLLPGQLPENLRLGTRSDGVNVWSAIIRENLDAVWSEEQLVELEAQVQIPPKK